MWGGVVVSGPNDDRICSTELIKIDWALLAMTNCCPSTVCGDSGDCTIAV
jgi:hypothetical protein